MASKRTNTSGLNQPKRTKTTSDEDEEDKNDRRIAKHLKNFENVITQEVFNAEISQAEKYEEGVILSRAYREGLRPAILFLLGDIAPKNHGTVLSFDKEFQYYMEHDEYLLTLVEIPAEITNCGVTCGCCGKTHEAGEWWKIGSVTGSMLLTLDRKCAVKLKNIVMIYNALRVLSGKAAPHSVGRPFSERELDGTEQRRGLLKSLLHMALIQNYE